MGFFAMDAKKTDRLQALRRELEFLDHGGYGKPLGWRPPLVFEDSPICLSKPKSDCLSSTCPLLEFLPQDLRERLQDQPSPCRHIPLNEAGETVESLYRTGTHAELETALRTWLTREIQRLEE